MSDPDAKLPSMNDHADALHPVTQPERQADPVVSAVTEMLKPGGSPTAKVDKFTSEQAKQQASGAAAKRYNAKRGM